MDSPIPPPPPPTIAVVPCTETCGPNVSLPPSPLGLFRLLFTPYLIQLIFDNMNLYAEQVLSPENYLKFEKVTSLEIQAYFGFMFLMGINKLPCLYDYWRTETTYFAPIASRITRARLYSWKPTTIHFYQYEKNTHLGNGLRLHGARNSLQLYIWKTTHTNKKKITKIIEYRQSMIHKRYQKIMILAYIIYNSHCTLQRTQEEHQTMAGKYLE